MSPYHRQPISSISEAFYVEAVDKDTPRQELAARHPAIVFEAASSIDHDCKSAVNVVRNGSSDFDQARDDRILAGKEIWLIAEDYVFPASISIDVELAEPT